MTYFQDESLKLELQYKSTEEWTLCFETGPVTIPSVSYLGFSAETGELSDNFDIISVDTKNLYNAVTSDYAAVDRTLGPNRKKGKKGSGGRSSAEGGGWGWFFVKVVVVILICGGGYVGWTMYRSSKRHSRFD